MEIKLETISGHSKTSKIGKINVQVGDEVKANDILLQLETNKGNSPFKAKGNFKIEEIKVSEGDEVKVGDVLFIVSGEIKTNNKPKVDYFGNMLKGKKEDVKADLLVIGGGPGGYVAALYAAKKGLNTVLVEREKLGGTCLNVGCIPTKALVKSSEVYKDTLLGEEFGFEIENIKVNMNKVIDRKDKIRENLVSGIDYLLSKNNVRVIKSDASFLDDKIIVAKRGKDEYKIEAKNIIVATGSKISKINIKGIDLPFVLNSKSALDNKNLPKSITIIGGGVIGMEFAFIYSNFGVKVNVVEYMDRLLTMVDDDISEEIKNIAKLNGINIYTSSKVTKIEESENGDAIVFFENEGKEKYLISENVLVAIGREPNMDGLNIEKTSIELNERGKGIKVDNTLKTNVPGIYAIGDVNNKMQLAHVASHQGIIAVDNILSEDKEMKYDCVPNVIFTAPEIASVGLTERECMEKKINIKVSKFPFSANGKALTMGESRGFIKIIKDTYNNKIVGASIIGADASSLISTLTVIIKNNIKDEEIADTIFAHPTTGEVIHEAALGLSIGAIHYHE
ncbi:MAG: dihydrolipoyl dehydrogenase [Clostridium baratii]|uniref:dihydrolipoyl dehydrogenase n=1 Tax=Clostridium baratii TaxID=1561 RepID=UPI0006C1E787|nr:dihydrolipoyl dehydrogenase [Clostridium baratii]MBS6005884.1 dihydrolipoyl dehydrogenase [Clostridium baratii]CUP19884.1 dihydrolipoyl dehydrogenase [Clostridium baratii]